MAYTKIFELLKKIHPGFSLTLSDATKRSNGEWYARWTYLVQDCNGGKLFESEWWGHKSADEALQELLKEILAKVKPLTEDEPMTILGERR